MGCYNEVKLSRTPALPWHTFYSEHKKHQQSNHSYEVQLMPWGEAHRGRGTTKCWQREGQDRRLEATFDWRRHGREEWQWVEENFKGSRSTRQPFLVQAIMIGTSGIMIALVLTVASNSYFLCNGLYGFTFLTFNFETIINWHSVVRNNSQLSFSHWQHLQKHTECHHLDWSQSLGYASCLCKVSFFPTSTS